MRDKINSFLNSFSTVQVISALIAALIAIFLWQSNEIQKFRVEQERARVVLEQEQETRLTAPATDWLEVREVFIPNFRVNEDPIIIVDRKIKKPFTGVWSVELESISKDGTIFFCSGGGKNHYEPDNILPTELRLSWWMGNNEGTICLNKELKPGSYRISSYWTVMPDEVGYLDRKKLVFHSNIFDITE